MLSHVQEVFAVIAKQREDRFLREEYPAKRAFLTKRRVVCLIDR